MKKLFQSLANGSTSIVEVTRPTVRENHLVVRSEYSLVSAGTERMLVEFGKANLLGKAKQQPEKVRQVLDKVKTDGLKKTYDSVKSKLDQAIELGYSNVGVVTAVGPGVKKYKLGDRVVSNGCHAEMVLVPENLCAKVPDSVDSSNAVFTVVSSIGLQGIRLANPTMGETVAVFGVGLIGLLTIQLLRAQGCKVLAIDIGPERLKLAEEFGAVACNSSVVDPVDIAMSMSDGDGIDAVIIAATSESDAIVSQSAKMCRKRGRIVLVGVTGLNLNRADFYEKELVFQVSCSYGAGRYDADYEEKGRDYPIGYVRWTEQRNFETVLALMEAGSLNASRLLTAHYDFADAASAYERLLVDKSCLGLVLDYDGVEENEHTIELVKNRPTGGAVNRVSVAIVGYGNYASSTLVPALLKNGAELHTAVTGSAAQIPNGSFRFQSNSLSETLSHPDISLVTICTRHSAHAEQVISALRAGKHVFVEKPLCLKLGELAEIEAAYRDSDSLLMVGFNRRFAPFIVMIKSFLAQLTVPKAFTMTVNAGHIPKEHWTQDIEQGGGRIIGEACHFIDLLRFLSGAEIVNSHIEFMESASNDSAVIILRFGDGSIGTINYLANGHGTLSKERLEVFAAGRFIQLDNFRKLELRGWPGLRNKFKKSQDKGQIQCVKETLLAITSGSEAPIPFQEISEVSRIAIELASKSPTKKA